MKLTILIPMLNEELTIRETVLMALNYLDKSKIKGEVLVIDNGSRDSSVNVIKDLNIRIIKEDKIGYGNALRRGIKEAKGKYIIMGDADTTYDFTNLDDFVNKLDQGYDLVMGNRFKGKREKGAMSLLHYIGIKFLTMIANIKFKTKLGDYHCGLRGFNTLKAKQMNFETTGMDFATEIIYQFKNNGFKITEIKTDLRRGNKKRKNHLRTFEDGFRHLNYIIKR